MVRFLNFICKSPKWIAFSSFILLTPELLVTKNFPCTFLREEGFWGSVCLVCFLNSLAASFSNPTFVLVDGLPTTCVGEGNGNPLQYSCLENPWTEEPGRLQSMGSLSRTQLSHFTFTFMHWRRKWQPTPVFLPGESQGWGSLVSCHLWGRTESDTTEAT